MQLKFGYTIYKIFTYIYSYNCCNYTDNNLRLDHNIYYIQIILHVIKVLEGELSLAPGIYSSIYYILPILPSVQCYIYEKVNITQHGLLPYLPATLVIIDPRMIQRSMDAAIVNEYKRAFIWRRVATTLMGGVQLLFPDPQPFYVYAIQVRKYDKITIQYQ